MEALAGVLVGMAAVGAVWEAIRALLARGAQ